MQEVESRSTTSISSEVERGVSLFVLIIYNLDLGRLDRQRHRAATGGSGQGVDHGGGETKQELTP